MKPYVDLEVAEKRAKEIVDECMVIARKRFNKPDLVTPPIIWKTMGFRTAGQAAYHNRNIFLVPTEIYMNINFLYSKDAERFVNSTIRHELAHALSYQIFGPVGCGHNRYWRQVCYVIGDDGERCHNYAIPENATNKSVDIKCTCGAVFHLTPLRLKRAKEGNYLCRCCKTNLKTLIH